MALDLGSLFRFMMPRRRATAVATTPTFRPASRNTVLTLPTYRDYATDLFQERLSAVDARTLLETLFRSDPDVSAAVNAYLTVADTEPLVFIRNVDGQFDREAYRTFEKAKLLLAHQADLTKGFELKTPLNRLCEQFRYMLLLRGAVACELVLDKSYAPSNVRTVDPASLRFYERENGTYKPTQKVTGQTEETSLDIPTFFISYFRNSPLSIYPTPPFMAAINTIASRQQVINDLYRIMAMTGFPRLDVEVLEQVLTNAAPANVRNNAADLRDWVNSRIAEIRSSFTSISADDSFVHTDAVKVKILNERNPGVGINVENIISVLNAQNQAGLKSVSTILGRGESGVNTASVESRVFALNADALNAPVAEILSRMFTVILQLAGHPVFCEIKFRHAELRPMTELEPHLVMRQSRLLDALSLGLITDEEFHIENFGRLPPDGAPVLSGTNFRTTGQTTSMEPPSPNEGPLNRNLTPEGGDSARSNQIRRVA